jgi:hypothetical protein
MPKEIDPAIKERVVKLVLEHQADYSSLFAAVSAVAKQQWRRRLSDAVFAALPTPSAVALRWPRGCAATSAGCGLT